MTNFQKVIHFNKEMGVLGNEDKRGSDIFDKNPKEVEFCVKLIDEEVNELHQAVNDKNYVETIDALSDILYVVYGMGARMGIDMDKMFDLVHENNMSKLCSSKEEAEATVTFYKQNPQLNYESPSYRLSPDGTKYVVYNESTKKILKSIHWKPVDFSSHI